MAKYEEGREETSWCGHCG